MARSRIESISLSLNKITPEIGSTYSETMSLQGKWAISSERLILRNIRESQNCFKQLLVPQKLTHRSRIWCWGWIWPPFWGWRPRSRAQGIFLNWGSNEWRNFFWAKAKKKRFYSYISSMQSLYFYNRNYNKATFWHWATKKYYQRKKKSNIRYFFLESWYWAIFDLLPKSPKS